MGVGWGLMGTWGAIAALLVGGVGVTWAEEPGMGEGLAPVGSDQLTEGTAEEDWTAPGIGRSDLIANPVPVGVAIVNRGGAGGETGNALKAGQLATLAQQPDVLAEESPEGLSEELELDPAIIEQSPVLRRWRQGIPDIAADIRQDPAFRPRLRLGYSHFPSNDGTGGLFLAAQDILLGQAPLALGLDYHRNGRGDRLGYGADLQYYLRPLGSYWNLAPVVGYRVLEAPGYRANGPQIGLRLVVIPSRTGAADLSLSQTWVLPSNSGSIGLTTLSVGYALTRHLRFATDIQWQSAPNRQDSRVGIWAEWLL